MSRPAAPSALATVGDDRFEIGPHTLAWRILDAEGALRADSQDALWMEIKPVSRSAVPKADSTAAPGAEVTQ